MKTLITLSLLVCFTVSGYGKANFLKRSELINKAEAIAIIDLGELVNPGKDKDDLFSASGEGVRGKLWSYTQKSKAKVVKLLAGKLPKEFFLYGGETFICAQCRLKKGRYLAFLRKDEEYWVGANWHLSLRPIKDNQVEWYVSEEQRFPMKYQDMQVVMKQIAKTRAEKK
ncbi:MAG: hypothetical protein KJO21_06050 [Verrucomicrobiae bacterium]|nr:hypothetical protein [Verrucomicrobiae bacterium]NNJ43849.1 hypothetical protein [Akkermansiaceae bacterium]